jgi:RNA recognition motif-containing protein
LNDIQIAAYFSNFGELKNVKIERFKDGSSKGSCFIKFEEFEDMQEAIN